MQAWAHHNEWCWENAALGYLKNSDWDFHCETEWCYLNYLSLANLRGILETAFQIRSIMVKEGYAPPWPRHCIDSMNKRHRRARRVETREDWQADMPPHQPPGSSPANIMQHWVQKFCKNMAPDTEPVLLWMICASFLHNLIGVKSDFRVKPVMTYESRRSNMNYNRGDKRRKNKRYQQMKVCDVKSKEYLEQFLSQMFGFRSFNVLSKPGRGQTNVHTVTFSNFGEAVLAVQLRPTNAHYPYLSCEQRIEVQHRRNGYPDDENMLVVSDTVCAPAGPATIASTNVIASRNERNNLIYLVLEQTCLPSTVIHKAILKATSATYPNCTFGGKAESSSALAPTTRLASDLTEGIRSELDLECSCYWKQGNYLNYPGTGLNLEVQEVITRRRQHVASLMAFYERHALMETSQHENKLRDEVTKKYRIAKDKTGKVIGKKEYTRKSIEKAYSVKLWIDNRSKAAYNVTIVSISGKNTAVKRARDHIGSLCGGTESDDE